MRRIRMSLSPITKINHLIYEDSVKAWEGINMIFLFGHKDLDIVRQGNAIYMYDTVVTINKSNIDPSFDLGRNFNYTFNKWQTLVSNYISWDGLKQLKHELFSNDGKKSFSIPFQFSNNHKHGKSCLISLLVSKQVNSKLPKLDIFMRSSEITKRLMVDLVLFHRMGEYLFDKQPFSVVIHFQQLFQDNHVLMMYHVHSNLRKLCRSMGYKFKEMPWYPIYHKFMTSDISDIRYKVHKRVVRVLRPDTMEGKEYPYTPVEDCRLKL